MVKAVRPLEVLAGPELEAAKAQPHHSGEVRGLKDAGGTGVVAIAPHVVEGRGGLVALSLLAGEQVDSERLDAAQVARLPWGWLVRLVRGTVGSRPVECVPGVDVIVACDVVLRDVGTVGTVLGRCTDEIWSRTCQLYRSSGWGV